MPPDIDQYCNRCGYPVHHQPRGTCPECGAFHDRAQPHTWSSCPLPAASHGTRCTRALLHAAARTAVVYLLVLLAATGRIQYVIARQILNANCIEEAFSFWFAHTTQNFGCFLQPELFAFAALTGATLTLGQPFRAAARLKPDPPVTF